MSDAQPATDKPKRTRTRRSGAAVKTADAAVSPAKMDAAVEKAKVAGVSRRAPRVRTKAGTGTEVKAAERHLMIAQCAYYRAESRGWITGGEMDDWLEAERQVDALLANRGGATKN